MHVHVACRGIAQRARDRPTESQPDDLAQLLDDGWAVNGGVIQFYGDMWAVLFLLLRM